MRSRKLGKTGLKVSELSLGTWGLAGSAYGPVPESEVGKVMDRAVAMGINLFETSHSYGRGQMERLLGEALAGSEHIVVTKWGTDCESKPPRKHFDRDYLRSSAEESRERLGDKVQLVALLHNPSAEAVKKGEAVETLQMLEKEGSICSWGVSAGNEEVAQAAIDAGAPIISLSYNILNVQPLRALAEKLEETETGILAHSVLFYGLLTGRWGPAKTFRTQDHRSHRWAPGSLRTRVQQLAAVRPLVSGDVTSMRSAALRFVLANPLVGSAILGPRSCAQLDQMVRECKGEPPYLSTAKLSSLESRLIELEVER